METLVYISFFILYAFCGYLFYLSNKIRRAVKEQDEARKKQITEAGNAITETLRVAFDNLKKNAAEHNKINGKITENSSRIHRLEQHISRTAKDFNQRKMNTDEKIASMRENEDE